MTSTTEKKTTYPMAVFTCHIIESYRKMLHVSRQNPLVLKKFGQVGQPH